MTNASNQKFTAKAFLFRLIRIPFLKITFLFQTCSARQGFLRLRVAQLVLNQASLRNHSGLLSAFIRVKCCSSNLKHGLREQNKTIGSVLTLLRQHQHGILLRHRRDSHRRAGTLFSLVSRNSISHNTT